MLLAVVFAASSSGCFDPKPADTACESATEIPYDGIDQDCDGADLTDVDGDGYDSVEAEGDDCDDDDAASHPDANETAYDGVDQDCDGVDLTDVDGDGYDSVEVDGGTDCDDEDADANPDATEVCDSIDNDCDGLVDDDDPGVTGRTMWYADSDGDSYGDASVQSPACDPPSGYVEDDSDCDDSDASINPGATEITGDGIDQDCNGYEDEYLVCADGSGDFSTIQDAVDAASDGSFIELCPGTYEEYVTIEDMELTIIGGGDHPEDVVLDGHSAGSAGFVISGRAANVTLHWMTIQPGSDAAGVRVEDEAVATIDTIDFCGSGWDGSLYVVYTDGNCTVANISRSWFCDAPRAGDRTGRRQAATPNRSEGQQALSEAGSAQ